MDHQLEPRPYFQILHNLIRQNDLDYDPEQIAASINWVRENANTLRKVCTTPEHEALVVIYNYWDKHKTAPDTKDMHQLIRERHQNQGLLDLMAEYEKNHQPELEQVSHLSLHLPLDQRIADWEKYQVTRTLRIASEIVVGSIPDPKDKAKHHAGPRDALKYLHERLQRGVLIDDKPVQGGVLADLVKTRMSRYNQAEAEARNNGLFIPSGISLIDGHLGGLRRKELNGILGFVGQRKSAILRTIGYNAANQGFRVLHIPLESDVQEEEDFYSIQHAAHLGFTTITKKMMDRNLLTKEEKDQLENEVFPDFAEGTGRNLTVHTPGLSRAWEDVKQIIQRENDKEPVDLVLLDYITLLSTPGNRDDKGDKMAIVQDAKRLAMNANDGRGLCLVTPVQGNRAGFEDAADRGGEWMTTGISTYSELDKSLDNLFYVYFDDEMNGQNQMKMGSCKTRRDSNIPASFVSVSTISGTIVNTETKEVRVVAAVDDKPRSLSDEVDRIVAYI